MGEKFDTWEQRTSSEISKRHGYLRKRMVTETVKKQLEIHAEKEAKQLKDK